MRHGLDRIPGDGGEGQSQCTQQQKRGAPHSALSTAQMIAFRRHRSRIGPNIRALRGVVVHQQTVLEGASGWAGTWGGCLAKKLWRDSTAVAMQRQRPMAKLLTLRAAYRSTIGPMHTKREALLAHAGP